MARYLKHLIQLISLLNRETSKTSKMDLFQLPSSGYFQGE